MPKDVDRLYHQFKPEHYDLSLKLDHKDLKFEGRVVIRGHKVGRPSKRLTFHQKDLKVDKAELIHFDKKGTPSTIQLDRTNNHAKYDELRLHSAQMLYPGLYQVTIHFSGKITKPMDGIYPCYFEAEGRKQHLLATQFESHHARQAFPCIDEPEAKATFQLSITTNSDHSVISNTPILETK